MNAPRNVSYQAYLLESLKDPQEAAAYMDAALELEDPAALLVALRHIAQAQS
jgi:DNA-binding phage protein